MSFLRINGRQISVAKMDEAEPEVGSRSRAVDGTQLIDRIGHVREWEGETPALLPAEINVIKKLLRGDGDVWPFDADLYSGKGVDEDPASVTSASILEGDAADGSGVLSSSPFVSGAGDSGGSAYSSRVTTNLFPQNVRDGTEDTTTTGFTLLAGGSIASSTLAVWQGSRSLLFLSGGTAADGFETATVAISSSTIYVASIYLLIGTANPGPVRIELIGDVSGVLATYNIATPNGAWSRYHVAATTGGSDTTVKLRVTDVNGVSNLAVFADGLQLEAGSGPSAWIDGARASADQLRYSMTDLASLMRGDFTIALWFSVSDTNLEGTLVQGLFTARDSANDNGIEIEEDGQTASVIVRSDGSSFSSGGGTYTPDAFSHVVVVVRRSPGAGEFNLTLYFDGAQVDADNGTVFDVDDLDQAFVGSFAGANQANGEVDDLMILPYAATAAQVSAWFGAGVAMAPLPKVYVDGDFIEDDPWTVLALGEVGKGGYRAAGGENNRRELRFGLVTESLET